ncbi:hypothetical protein ACF07T_15275 [Streptomyces sp. NPDC015184]|uniref:hypothetical protein n=1 Tax=Streptomyces sp. NPDC015184 TaxID=3364946 RepID=UPI0036F72AE7
MAWCRCAIANPPVPRIHSARHVRELFADLAHGGNDGITLLAVPGLKLLAEERPRAGS